MGNKIKCNKWQNSNRQWHLPFLQICCLISRIFYPKSDNFSAHISNQSTIQDSRRLLETTLFQMNPSHCLRWRKNSVTPYSWHKLEQRIHVYIISENTYQHFFVLWNETLPGKKGVWNPHQCLSWSAEPRRPKLQVKNQPENRKAVSFVKYCDMSYKAGIKWVREVWDCYIFTKSKRLQLLCTDHL